MRRRKNDNRIDNAWKKLNRKQKTSTAEAINRIITTQARSGQSARNGQLETGALQLFNLIATEYATFGMNNGGDETGDGAIVAP